MKNAILILLIPFLFTSCMTTANNFTASSSEYKGKYTSHLKADEQEVSSWYHYVTSKNARGQHIVRTFYPETKQITSYVTYTNSSATTKQGPVRFWLDNGTLLTEGNFHFNEMFGYWKRYFSKNGSIQSEGNYANGKAEGIWKYYNLNGKLIKEVNYKKGVEEGGFIQYDSLGSIINKGVYKDGAMFHQTNPIEKDEISTPVLSSSKHIEDPAERNIYSSKMLLTHIAQTIKYPISARDYGIQGGTLSQFYIEPDGSITDITILSGLNEDVKKECIRIIKSLPKWEAGTKNGEKVRALFQLSLNFNFQHISSYY